jgi:hypothetical protein
MGRIAPTVLIVLVALIRRSLSASELVKPRVFGTLGDVPLSPE